LLGERQDKMAQKKKFSPLDPVSKSLDNKKECIYGRANKRKNAENHSRGKGHLKNTAKQKSNSSPRRRRSQSLYTKHLLKLLPPLSTSSFFYFSNVCLFPCPSPILFISNPYTFKPGLKPQIIPLGTRVGRQIRVPIVSYSFKYLVYW
jgi:hypothetical protein